MFSLCYMTEQHGAKGAKEEGNSISSSPNKVTRINQALGWCFTLNNYTSEMETNIQDTINKYCKIGFYNKEVGESGTPHLQGYIEFKIKDRPLSKFINKKIHWTKAKGNQDQNFKYCSKDCANDIEMSFEMGVIRKKKLKTISVLKDWQKQCVDYIDKEHSEEDDRTINWIIDDDGCSGKTALCKYLYKHEKQLLIITGGGYKDIACCLKIASENKEFDINDRTTILFNIPRDSDDQGMISYKALESLKDGLITSTKYESSTMCFNSPVVWVFSNNEPDISKLSKDRWRIFNLKDGLLWNITDND